MSTATKPMHEAAIRQYAKHLRLPTVGSQFARLAEQVLVGPRIQADHAACCLVLKQAQAATSRGYVNQLPRVHMPPVEAEHQVHREAPVLAHGLDTLPYEYLPAQSCTAARANAHPRGRRTAPRRRRIRAAPWCFWSCRLPTLSSLRPRLRSRSCSAPIWAARSIR